MQTAWTVCMPFIGTTAREHRSTGKECQGECACALLGLPVGLGGCRAAGGRVSCRACCLSRLPPRPQLKRWGYKACPSTPQHTCVVAVIRDAARLKAAL